MSADFRALCAELVKLSAPTDSIPQLAERLQKLSELASRARAALAQPEPADPSLNRQALCALSRADKDALINPLTGEVVALRTILNKEQSDTIRRALLTQPVPVSERLPGPEDCDKQGRCWWYGEGADMIGWTLDAEGVSYYRAKFWLPANALPTPEATNG